MVQLFSLSNTKKQPTTSRVRTTWPSTRRSTERGPRRRRWRTRAPAWRSWRPQPTLSSPFRCQPQGLLLLDDVSFDLVLMVLMVMVCELVDCNLQSKRNWCNFSFFSETGKNKAEPQAPTREKRRHRSKSGTKGIQYYKTHIFPIAHCSRLSKIFNTIMRTLFLLHTVQDCQSYSILKCAHFSFALFKIAKGISRLHYKRLQSTPLYSYRINKSPLSYRASRRWRCWLWTSSCWHRWSLWPNRYLTLDCNQPIEKLYLYYNYYDP